MIHFKMKVYGKNTFGSLCGKVFKEDRNDSIIYLGHEVVDCPLCIYIKRLVFDKMTIREVEERYRK